MKMPNGVMEWLKAMADRDLPRARDSMVEAKRDPQRWFCIGIEEGCELPDIWGYGDSKAEARTACEAAAGSG
jgi:hypothetical protein